MSSQLIVTGLQKFTGVAAPVTRFSYKAARIITNPKGFTLDYMCKYFHSIKYKSISTKRKNKLVALGVPMGQVDDMKYYTIVRYRFKNITVKIIDNIVLVKLGTQKYQESTKEQKEILLLNYEEDKEYYSKIGKFSIYYDANNNTYSIVENDNVITTLIYDTYEITKLSNVAFDYLNILFTEKLVTISDKNSKTKIATWQEDKISLFYYQQEYFNKKHTPYLQLSIYKDHLTYSIHNQMLGLIEADNDFVVYDDRITMNIYYHPMLLKVQYAIQDTKYCIKEIDSLSREVPKELLQILTQHDCLPNDINHFVLAYPTYYHKLLSIIK